MRTRLPWRKTLFLSTVLAASGVGGLLAVHFTSAAAGDEQVKQRSTKNDPALASEESVIQKLKAAYVEAFNAGDAKALASFWVEDGEFVDAEGHALHGRDAIEKDFAAFFKKAKGLSLEATTESLRFVNPGVALETGSSRLLRSADETANLATYSIVHIKRDGKWYLASVRETTSVPSSNYHYLRDIEWLVGTWAAKGSGHNLEITGEWSAKRSFLIRKYSLKGADGVAKTGLQVIGWDPVAGGFRSWLFDSDGGFGSERWTRDGKRWIQEATGVTRDGAQTTATNVLNRLDNDRFTWQSVQRSLNQVRLPDTAVITIERVKQTKE